MEYDFNRIIKIRNYYDDHSNIVVIISLDGKIKKKCCIFGRRCLMYNTVYLDLPGYHYIKTQINFFKSVSTRVRFISKLSWEYEVFIWYLFTPNIIIHRKGKKGMPYIEKIIWEIIYFNWISVK